MCTLCVCDGIIPYEAPLPNLNFATIFYAQFFQFVAKLPNLKTANISGYMVLICTTSSILFQLYGMLCCYVLQILVGYLQGNKQTGGVELSDSTGSVPVVCSVPLHNDRKQQGHPVMHWGCKVLINQATVYVEKTAEGQSTPWIAIYIYVNEITFALEIPRKASSESQGSSVHNPRIDESEGAGSTDCLYFVAISKNALVVEPSTSSLSFTMQAQVHTNLNILNQSESLQEKQEQDKSITSSSRIALEFPSGTVQWYSYLSVGCLYCLSTASKRLPSLKSLQNEPCITVEDSMEIHFIQSVAGSIHCCQPVLDVADVISKLFLPRLSTVSTVESPGRLVPLLM